MNQLTKRKTTILTAGIVLVAAIGAAAATGFVKTHQPASPEPSVAGVTAGALVFADEFDGTTLDKRKWNTCYDNFSLQYDGCTNQGNFESQWYKPAQVSVADGHLVLSAKRQTTAGLDQQNRKVDYPFVSGMISTGRYMQQTPEKWSQTYGFYEARMYVPGGQAVWPAFWLSPVDHHWPPEIDIMELLGDKPDQLLNTYFWKGAGDSAAKDSSLYQASENLTAGWHVYAVDWRAGSLDWYLDGKKVKHVSSQNVTDSKMQINLNLAVGGQLPGPPTNATPDSAQMLVDYVRVYR